MEESLNPYDETKRFEKAIANYTGAPYVVALDSCSNAIFLSLVYDGVKDKEISIPCRTYMSVPCEIIHAGGIVKFLPMENGDKIKGAYQLKGSKVWDSALRFTANMYIPNSFMCCSFTGKYKPMKLGKGGCILTDNEDAYKWFKKVRFSGRDECDYFDDDFKMLGWNFYLHPIFSTLGLQLIGQFYDQDGNKISSSDVESLYPDLSKYPIYTNHDNSINSKL
jgi:dTDP-4-amino-4,6-dideoxygalactose transaminase